MKKTMLHIFSCVLAVCSNAATGYPVTARDSFPQVKVITNGGKIVLGQLQYATDDSLYILPGTRKEARKGNFYEQLSLSYKDVVSVRVQKNDYWFELILGLAGITGIVLMITGVVPIIGNGLGDANILILLSPVFLGSAIWKLLRKKRYVINGRKDLYDQFRLKLKKMK